MLEKQPGWKIMAKLVEEVNGLTPLGTEEDEGKAKHLGDLMDILTANCLARQNEVFPENADVAQIITGVMTAFTANCVRWPNGVVNFVMSQNGENIKAIETFLAKQPGWKAEQCPDPDCGKLHVSNKELMAKKALNRLGIGGIMDILIIGGTSFPPQDTH